jgi:pre-mRNA-splicing factor CDC5/CEF1
MPVVKGGVWTNIEDEILKAAVSKYGLSQWARVSSLLARKTAKQCKARWTQWLDPGIKKTEWSKEEDEKLLHLAKLMPTQWQTIGPIVGRTATQCLERYQRLLDDAEAAENDELGLGGPDGGETSAPTGDDVRKLRPGETDPDPESKPARPDTIDLDEDEKEMLSEARARLANTQGKKAKRKARERQLEESRRLAVLQKRRELKNAGINIKITTRKKGQMDYNADIPFEKAPAAGFHDTLEEEATNERERESFDPRKQQLARKRQGDQDEDKDPKRQKQDKDKAAAAAAARAGQMQQMREADRRSSRKVLSLPAPQVNEEQLEDIVKMGMSGDRAVLAAGEDATDTQRLTGGYTNTLGATPLRTPRAAPQDDHIANEIRNIRALTNTHSSLLGGDNTPLAEGQASTGFDGVAPRRNQMVTPNPMATPMRNGVNGVGATPLRLGTPRDNYALNASEQVTKASLRAKLASLPKPKAVSWELEELPDEKAESQEPTITQEDQEEIDRRTREAQEKQRLEEFRRESSVFQKALPRPRSVNYAALTKAALARADPIEAQIASEAALLMANDAYKHGSGAKSSMKAPPALPKLPDSLLDAARAAIAEEVASDPAREAAHKQSTEAYFADLDANNDMPHTLPPSAPASAYHAPFAAANTAIHALAEQDSKTEALLKKLHGGYMARQKMLRKSIVERFDEIQTKRTELECFSSLKIGEDAALTRRLEGLREEVGNVMRREREAQEEFRQLKEGAVNGS